MYIPGEQQGKVWWPPAIEYHITDKQTRYTHHVSASDKTSGEKIEWDLLVYAHETLYNNAKTHSDTIHIRLAVYV